MIVNTGYVLLYVLTLRHVIGYTYHDVNTLHAHMFKKDGYNRNTRPIKNQSLPVQIRLLPGVLALERYDITTGTVAIQGFYYMSWTDELLVWDPSLFNGIQRITVQGNAIWTPDLVFLDAMRPTALTTSMAQAYWLNSDGVITMYTGGLYESKCDTETRKYPLDFHKCRFTVLASKYDGTEVVIDAHPDVDLQNFTENEEWHLDTAFNHEYFPEKNGIKWSFVDTTFVISRRPTFVFMHDFTSISLLCWLNTVTCLVPSSSGERLSFSVTLFLAFSVQSSQISETLPRNARSLVPFSLCLTITNILCALGTVWSVLILRLSKLNPEKYHIPGFLQKLHLHTCKCGKAKLGKIKIKPVLNVSKVTLNDLETETNNDHKPNNGWTSESDDSEDKSDMEHNKETVTWLKVSETLDNVYFVLVTLVLVLFYSGFFIVVIMY